MNRISLLVAMVAMVAMVGCFPTARHYYRPTSSIGMAVPMMVNYQTGPREGLFINRDWGEIYVNLVSDASVLEITLYSQEGEPLLISPVLEMGIGNVEKITLPVTEPDVLKNYVRGRHWGGGWTRARYQIPLPADNLDTQPEKLILSSFEVSFKEDQFVTSEIVFRRAFSTYLLPVNY